MLASQHEPRIEVYRRSEGHFAPWEAGPGEAITLATTGAALAVDAVYRDPLA